MRGVVLVATGAETYIELAARAAASVKRHCPGLAVDLYTDAERALPVFDRVHRLDDPWFRSKIDALLQSRFERTLYMDADMLALADFRDVFEVLERFDIALAHDWLRNSPLHHTFWRKPLPPAFPMFNGGAFLEAWRAAVRATDTGRDQISLRELLWESELRIATLPEEYNLLWIQGVKSWTTDFAAPRIIHSPTFHRDYARYARARDPAAERMGLVASARLPELIAADRGLARLRGEAPRPIPPGDRAWVRRVLAGLPRTLAGRLRRLARR
jgi:hypothetical protein